MSSTEARTFPGAWSRFVPSRFTLRTALLMMTVAALCTWWLTWWPPGTITKDQAEMVRDGMTKAEVLTILGEPAHRRYLKTIPEVWIYEVNIPVAVPVDANDFYKAGKLVVMFSKADERVSRSLNAYYDHDDHK